MFLELGSFGFIFLGVSEDCRVFNSKEDVPCLEI